MAWLVFSYSLPAQSRSSRRVTVWRRLRQIGALAVAGGAQVLPAQADGEQAFQWMAQEIRAAQGEAVLMRVKQFAGLPDAELIAQFQAARAADYAELEPEVKRLERALKGKDRFRLPEALDRVRRKHAAIAQIDYYACPVGARLATRLDQVERALTPVPAGRAITSAAVSDYQNRHWVTRPHPHVDRLACAWLIRRFIDPQAVIRYSLEPKAGEVTFDMEPADFGHRGDLCSFETLTRAFGFYDPGFAALAEIVHDIDLHQDPHRRPETPGVQTLLTGWRLANLPDAESEARGLILFDGLYAAFLGKPAAAKRRARKST